MRQRRNESAVTGEFGEPLISGSPDLRSYCWMKLDVCRLMSSDFFHLADNEEFGAAVKLWTAAMRQVPAGSLPNNNRIVASLAGYANAARRWNRVREMALYGWLPCSDGRLYHPMLAELVQDVQESPSVKKSAEVLSSNPVEERRRKSRERVRKWRRAQAEKTEDAPTESTNVRKSKTSDALQESEDPRISERYAERNSNAEARYTERYGNVTVTQIEIEKENKKREKTHCNTPCNADGVTESVTESVTKCVTDDVTSSVTECVTSSVTEKVSNKITSENNDVLSITPVTDHVQGEPEAVLNSYFFGGEPAPLDDELCNEENTEFFLENFLLDNLETNDGFSRASNVAPSGVMKDADSIDEIQPQPVRREAPIEPFAQVCSLEEAWAEEEGKGSGQGGTSSIQSSVSASTSDEDSANAEADNSETSTTTASRFNEFWEVYPTKTGRKPCLKKWQARKLDRIADQIIENVKSRRQTDKRWLDGRIPNPLTYINQDRWEDDIETVGHIVEIDDRSPVTQVFNHWKKVMDKKHAVLDTSRSQLIVRSLEIYGLQRCLDAIDGCAETPFYMGENDKQTAFNGLSLIFRDAEHVERFYGMKHRKQKTDSESERILGEKGAQWCRSNLSKTGQRAAMNIANWSNQMNTVEGETI